jgi:DegV family protein with EDD domain
VTDARVGIVTDTAASLPPEVVTAHGIEVVRMYLSLDGDSFREGERAVDVLAVADRVKTSGPTPADFAEAISRRDAGAGVLVLTIAATMSSTHEAAALAARDLSDGADVRVVDTTTAAGAEGLVVLAAAEAAERGLPLDDVEAAARRAVEEVRLVATVPNLDHLVRSGRVPNIAGWAGRRLGISPLFEFRSGKARPLRPALSTEAAYDRMLQMWRKDLAAGDAAGGSAPRLHVAALHARAPEAAADLLERVRADGVGLATTPTTSFVGEFGLVMMVHAGPGLVGLAWRWERDPTAG